MTDKTEYWACPHCGSLMEARIYLDQGKTREDFEAMPAEECGVYGKAHTAHTLEPWQTGAENPYPNSLGGTTVFPWEIVAPLAFGEGAAPLLVARATMPDSVEGLANANRIVACVNGCKDLNPEGYRGLVEAMGDLLAQAESLLAHSTCAPYDRWARNRVQDAARTALEAAKKVTL